MTAPRVSGTPPAIRSVIAVAAGVFVGGIAIFGVEALSHLLVPPPRGLDVADAAVVQRAMATLPARHFVPILAGYTVGPALGAALAARMAPARAFAHAATVAAVFLAGAIMNFINIPHPLWFVALSLAAFAASPIIGTRLAGR